MLAPADTPRQANPPLGPARSTTLWRPILAMMVVFVVAGAGYLATFGPSSAITSDDGSYAFASDARANGSWVVPYAFAHVDPDGIAYPNRNVERFEQGYVPNSRSPAWTLALAAGRVVDDTWGMRSIVLMAGAAAIAASAALAVAIGRRDAALWAAGLVALSPLAFNSLQLWAHVPATAAIAVALIGAVRLVQARSWGVATAMASMGAGFAAAFRVDALVFAGAIALGLGLVALVQRRPSLIVSATAITGAALVTRLSGRAIGLGAGVERRSAGAATSDRIDGWLATIISSSSTSKVAFMLLLLALVCVGFAVRSATIGAWRPATLLVLVAIAAWTIRIVIDPGEIADGLLGAWPVAGAAFLPRRAGADGSRVSERYLLFVAVVGTVGVAVTQYDNGGGFNWGGRYLASSIPILSVLAAVRLRELQTATDGRRMMALTIGVLAVIVGAASVIADVDFRHRTASLVDDIVVVAASASGEDRPVVVTGQPSLPLLAWRTSDDLDWLRVPADEDGGALALAEILHDAAVDEIVVVYLVDEQFSELTGRMPSENRPGEPVVIRVR